MSIKKIVSELSMHEDPIRATHSQRFFKTGKGEYGEGDVFIGITMPEIRSVCRNYRDLSIHDLQSLLNSPIHEHRMAAVVIMADVFQKSSSEKQKQLFDLYLKNVRDDRINNWDLIDVSTPHIIGAYIVNKDPAILYDLATSDHLWSKRTAVLATAAHLKTGDSLHTYAIAKLLIHDAHDLIQKAVGWFLREAGKRVNEQELLLFLDEHSKEMPRTMLRYSIEKLDPELRHHYMKR